jgi:glycosyltransferase involved in cell wall biosynthesis
MFIGFESSILNRSMTGVANYTFNIVRCALELEPDLCFTGFRDFDWRRFDLATVERITRSQRKQGDSETSNVVSLARIRDRLLDRVAGLPGSRAAGAVYREIRKGIFASSVQKQSFDLFHAFNFRPLTDPGVPTLPVIYDLSTFRHPQLHPPDRVKWLESLRELVERAPLIHTISDFSRREIADVFGYPLTQIFVAPPAASPLFVAQGIGRTQPGLDALNLTYGEFFLVVGTHEPRKNIRTAILAYERLPRATRARCPLVLAGGRGWGDLDLPAQTEALIREGSIRFVHGIADPQLRNLYEGARLLVAPSLYEGFGMPVVEALACGTPVAHSADTSMDEISGEAGTRVAALDVDGWSHALKQSLDSNDHTNSARREERIARARHFDWQRSAGLVVDAYRRIMDSRR